MSGLPGHFSPGYFQLGLQFIQIGSDSQARSYLEKLDNDLKEKYSIRVRRLPKSLCISSENRNLLGYG
jgi:hypothetical protein